MIFSEYEYRGETYIFEPPIDTGDRNPTHIADLVAIALEGAEISDQHLDKKALAAHYSMVNDGALVSTDRALNSLNTLLAGKHKVAVLEVAQ